MIDVPVDERVPFVVEIEVAVVPLEGEVVIAVVLMPLPPLLPPVPLAATDPPTKETGILTDCEVATTLDVTLTPVVELLEVAACLRAN